jgi:polyphenol oxidase
MDLHTANQRQLIGAGLSPDAITTIAECSACTRTADGQRRYFSHRAERGITGRMMSMIGVRAN